MASCLASVANFLVYNAIPADGDYFLRTKMATFLWTAFCLGVVVNVFFIVLAASSAINSGSSMIVEVVAFSMCIGAYAAVRLAPRIFRCWYLLILVGIIYLALSWLAYRTHMFGSPVTFGVLGMILIVNNNMPIKWLVTFGTLHLLVAIFFSVAFTFYPEAFVLHHRASPAVKVVWDVGGCAILPLLALLHLRELVQLLLRKLEQTSDVVRVTEQIARCIRYYDVEGIECAIEDFYESLDPQLVKTYREIADNLRSYKTFLPPMLFAVDDDDDGDDNESSAALIDASGEDGGGDGDGRGFGALNPLTAIALPGCSSVGSSGGHRDSVVVSPREQRATPLALMSGGDDSTPVTNAIGGAGGVVALHLDDDRVEMRSNFNRSESFSTTTGASSLVGISILGGGGGGGVRHVVSLAATTAGAAAGSHRSSTSGNTQSTASSGGGGGEVATASAAAASPPSGRNGLSSSASSHNLPSLLQHRDFYRRVDAVAALLHVGHLAAPDAQWHTAADGFDLVAATAAKFDGEVCDIIGDAILVTWNVSVSRRNSMQLALQCCLAIQREVCDERLIGASTATFSAAIMKGSAVHGTVGKRARRFLLVCPWFRRLRLLAEAARLHNIVAIGTEFNNAVQGIVRTRCVDHVRRHDDEGSLFVYEVVRECTAGGDQTASREWLEAFASDANDLVTRALFKLSMGQHDEGIALLAELPPQMRTDRSVVLMERHAHRCAALGMQYVRMLGWGVPDTGDGGGGGGLSIFPHSSTSTSLNASRAPTPRRNP